MKLSNATVAGLKLPDGKTEIIVFDDTLPGFGLRIRSGGKRTWIAQYRVGTKQRRLSLGTVEALDAAQARKSAREAIAKVQLGQDPQADKTELRKPKAPALTIGDIVERYLPHAEKRMKPSTFYGVKLHLRTHWAPLLHYELQIVERRHVAAELSRIAGKSGLVGANRSRAALSALFTWAIGEGLADTNPVVGTNKATDEKPRERVLSDAELVEIWKQAGTGDYGDIIRLLILTAQRREEVGGMLWSEISIHKAIWTIGASRTKNKSAHDVPLSAPALEILSRRPRQEDRDLVFGAGTGQYQGWSNAKASLDGRLVKATKARKDALAEMASDKTSDAILDFTEDWRLHDIRRTVATRLGDLGVLPHVVEAILNHISGSKAGVAGIYNRAAYVAEKRAALILWANHLKKLIGE